MDSSPHILVVDDHRDIRDLLGQVPGQARPRVSTADGGAAMQRLLKASAIDLVVLDIMMPGEDGLSLCRHLRETTDLPVILLTAMAEETDRVVGLEIGADDYVTKPFNPRELLARIKAVLRRAQSLPRQRGGRRRRLRFDRWTFDPAGASCSTPTAPRCRSARPSSAARRFPATSPAWCCRATSCST